MGLTYNQAKSIGMGHLHPAVSGGRSGERQLMDRLAPAVKGAVISDGMNKLERRFRDNILEPAYVRGDLAAYYREPFRLVLTGQTTYRPDFVAVERPAEQGLPPRLVVCEIKGFFRDDAKLKIKWGASSYPCFRWLVIYHRRHGGWIVQEVDSRGIGGEVIVPWINGG